MKGRELLRARKTESREPGKDSEEEEAVSLSEREMECREEKRWREGGGWRGETKEMGSVGGCSLAK